MSVTVGITPKAFSGRVGDIQRAAISSWINAGAQVILLGDETGTKEAARELGASHVPRVPLSASGLPQVPGLIAAIIQEADHPVRGLVNADILLVSEIGPVASRVQQTLPSGQAWLGVARRTNVAWSLIESEPPESLESTARASGRLHPASGCDVFLFGADPWPTIPPLVIGRTFWDAWLIWAAHQHGSLVVDLTPSLLTLHPDEDMDRESLESIWFSSEAAENQRMTRQRGRTVLEADRVLLDGHVRHWSTSPAHLLGRFPSRLIRSALRASPGLRRALLLRRWR